jgi:hypothetical protein
VVDNDFQWVGGDPCLLKPLNCSRGLSMSLFYKGITGLDPKDLDREPTVFTRKYMLSTGGGRGRPGVGIFLLGPYIGKIV